MYEPWYHGRFCGETPILVNFDLSTEVDKWLSKSGSRIINNNINNNGFICIAARMLDYTISATQDSAYNRTLIII